MSKSFRSIYYHLVYLAIIAFTFTVAPSVVLAQVDILTPLGGAAQKPFGAPATGVAEVTPAALIGQIITVALGFVGTVTFIVFLYGGFLWLTARGNEDQVGKAKKYLTNGAIGTIIVILAYALTFYITEVLYGATRA